MVDRVVDPENDIPVEDVDDVLKAVIVAVLDEAADKMEAGKDVIPFTGLAVKENLFIETHPGDDAEECFLAARKEVQGARGATAYAFCYDGYVDTDEGQKDALIAEGGLPGEEQGYAFGYLYDEDGIEREVVYIGPAPKTSSLSLRWREPSILKNRKKQPRNRKLGRGSRQRCRLSFFAR